MIEIDDYRLRYSQILMNRPNYAGYNDVKRRSRSLFAKMETRHSREGLAKFHRFLLLSMMEQFCKNQRAVLLPDSILELYPKQFVRMLTTAASGDTEFYHYSNDSFTKDSNICSPTLILTGARVVELEAGLPRRSLLKQGLWGSARALRIVLIELHGFRPLCGIHAHTEILEEFDFEGHERMFRRWSDLLKIHPDIKGIIGSAWFYDPAVKSISPHLACVRSTPEINGAYFLEGGTQTRVTDDALSTSRTRRDLYNAGRYRPKQVYMLWPRRPLINWADGI